MTETETEHEHGDDVYEHDTHPDAPDAPDDDDDDDETEAAAGPTPDMMEKRIKRAEASTKRYEKQVRDALEEEAENLIECPLCLPFARGFLHLGDRGNVQPEVEKAVRLWFGELQEVEYPESAQHRTCSECQGLGQVSTGSRVPEWQRIVCPSCQGKGFTGAPVAHTNGHLSPDDTQRLEETPVGSGDAGDVDPTGEPRILPSGIPNPNFGKWPQFKIEVPPWGTTAGLGMQAAV